MRYKIKSLITLFAIVLSTGLGFMPSMAVALDCNQSNLTTQEAIQCGANGAGGTTQTSQQGENNINATIKNIINLLSVIVGVVAVIMIIIAGFRYITSGGKQESVASAKNGILYAIIGLVIAALAQVIVRFVLHNATK